MGRPVAATAASARRSAAASSASSVATSSSPRSGTPRAAATSRILRAGDVDRLLLGEAHDAHAGRLELLEHLGRPGVVVGEHDGGVVGQDRLGDERALVADLRRLLGRRRVRRRDVGGDDLVAEPEGVDDLGEVAVDRDDALDARRRRGRAGCRGGDGGRRGRCRRRARCRVVPVAPVAAARRDRHDGDESDEPRPHRRAGRVHELDDQAAHVLVRRRRFGERQADDGEAGVAVEVGDVLAAEAVDVAHRGRRDGRAERLCAQQHPGIGVVVVHVGGDAVAVGEDGIDVGTGVGVGVDPVHLAEPADPADRPHGQAEAAEVAVPGVAGDGRDARGDQWRSPPSCSASGTGAASPMSVTRPRASGSVPAHVRLGDEQAGPGVAAEVAGVLGERGDHEQRGAALVEAVRDDRAERVARRVEGDRREGAGRRPVDQRARRIGGRCPGQVASDDPADARRSARVLVVGRH